MIRELVGNLLELVMNHLDYDSYYFTLPVVLFCFLFFTLYVIDNSEKKVVAALVTPAVLFGGLYFFTPHLISFMFYFVLSGFNIAEAEYQVHINCHCQSDKAIGYKKVPDNVGWLMNAARHGHTEAQYLLAGYYSGERECGWTYKENGEERKCIVENDDEAFSLYTEAAESGHPSAQGILGICYSEELLGQKQDFDKAFHWLGKAAESYENIDDQILKGNVLCHLGYCYLAGQGVEPNYEQGIYWLRKAADEGDNLAKDLLKDLEEC